MSSVPVIALVVGSVVAAPDLGALSSIEWIMMLLLSWTSVGLILAWRWEARGGAMSLASVVALHILGWTTDSLPLGWALPAFALPGLLFVASSHVARRAASAGRRAAS